MTGLTKMVFRGALIGGLVLGGATLVLGPERIAAGCAQVRHFATGWFDGQIDDPVLMRQQLQTLQRQYPERIKDLRGSLAEVDAQVAQLRRDSEVAAKVVDMARNDLASLGSMVDRANVQLAGNDGNAVLIKFQGKNITVEEAFAKGTNIKQTAVAYQDRLAANERDLKLLTTQRTRLAEQLEKTQREYMNFQTQAWSIERQIAAVERNEKIVDMLQDNQDAIESGDKWKVASLDDMQNRLAALQAENEALLETMGSIGNGTAYEERAKGELATGSNPFVWDIQPRTASQDDFPVAPVIIDEDDAKSPATTAEVTDAAMASADNKRGG